jgi:hypothetical protein
VGRKTRGSVAADVSPGPAPLRLPRTRLLDHPHIDSINRDILGGYPHQSIVAKYGRLCPQFPFDEKQLKYYIRVVIRGLLKKMVDHQRLPSLAEYDALKADLDKSPSALEGLDELSDIGLGLIRSQKDNVTEPAQLNCFVGILDHVATVLDLKSRLTGEHPEAKALLAGIGAGGQLAGGGNLIQMLGGVVVIPRSPEVEALERERIAGLQRIGREPELVRRGLEGEQSAVESAMEATPIEGDTQK